MKEIKKTGYVTFADILGWKGIWRVNNDENPADNLLEIRDDIKEYIEKLKAKYYNSLINNELKEYIDEDKINILSRNLLKGIGEPKSLIIEYLKDPSSSSVRYDIRDKTSKLDINLSIELISDTFIITTFASDISIETIIHSMIVQRLIYSCLKKGFLIRGATSYGEYYRNEQVFVGPAIDDSASWHELGEEIGVFFTPKALMIIDNKNISIKDIQFDGRKLSDIIFFTEPKLKIETFKTYIINWFDGEDDFKNIIINYDTILPEIYKKVIFSSERLEKF